jgi:hypothetical protein
MAFGSAFTSVNLQRAGRISVGMLGLATALAIAGCGDEPATDHGTVEVSLIGQAPSGTTYRLRSAIIMVQGPATTQFFDTEENPDSPTISADVVVGNYHAFLQEGWQLERLAADGTAGAVEAQLISPNPQSFVVTPDARTQVQLLFRVDGVDVPMDRGSFDIVIGVDEQPSTPGYCTTDAECGSGQTCCLAGFLGTCQTLAEGEACPLPDLTVSAEAAASSITFGYETFSEGSCALIEGCVAEAGDRRLMRFDTQTPNVGQSDMILGDPTGVDGFEFSSCHGHYHFEGYAAYQLIDTAGKVAARGHKQAFCLLDSTPVRPGAPASPRYHCGFQGIQAGWSDVYGSGLDCQWVDITGVAAGEYLLRIEINTDRTLPESDYSNNAVEVPVTITADVPPVPGDVLGACPSGAGGPERDCGWQFASGFEGATCTPGTTLSVGCGECGGGGTCSGDPVLRVCDGAGPCLASQALALVDDTCGFCPQTTFTCPTSGVYSVLTGAFNAPDQATCDVTAI